jgi:hypothetical protein
MLRAVAVGIALGVVLAGCATAPPKNAVWMQDERTGSWCYARPETDWAMTCPNRTGVTPDVNASGKWWKLVGDAMDAATQGADAVRAIK